MGAQARRKRMIESKRGMVNGNRGNWEMDGGSGGHKSADLCMDMMSTSTATMARSMEFAHTVDSHIRHEPKLKRGVVKVRTKARGKHHHRHHHGHNKGRHKGMNNDEQNRNERSGSGNGNEELDDDLDTRMTDMCDENEN